MTKPVDKTGAYYVYASADSDRVYFEHETRGEDDSICCYLHGNRVIDYDMAYEMLPEARRWLDSNGYNTEDILG